MVRLMQNKNIWTKVFFCVWVVPIWNLSVFLYLKSLKACNLKSVYICSVPGCPARRRRRRWEGVEPGLTEWAVYILLQIYYIVYPPANISYTLLQIYHIPFCKYIIYPPPNISNKRQQILKVIYPPANKSYILLQLNHTYIQYI